MFLSLDLRTRIEGVFSNCPHKLDEQLTLILILQFFYFDTSRFSILPFYFFTILPNYHLYFAIQLFSYFSISLGHCFTNLKSMFLLQLLFYYSAINPFFYFPFLLFYHFAKLPFLFYHIAIFGLLSIFLFYFFTILPFCQITISILQYCYFRIFPFPLTTV